MNGVQSEDSGKHPCHVVGKELVVIKSYAIYALRIFSYVGS